MRYFVKKSTPSKKGVYLQIYISGYVPGKGSRNRSYEKLGYVEDLKKSGIADPIKYAYERADDLNNKNNLLKEKQIGEVSLEQNVGYFLVKAMCDKLNFDRDINLVSSSYKAHYAFSDFLKMLVYAQIVSPGSKLKAAEKVIPSMYAATRYSYDQILDGTNFLGSDYTKFIEVLNHHIAKNYERNYKTLFFDCTNYYFEIDAEDDVRRKGPSKEGRSDPIISQSLLLDGDMIPLDMELFPGNESEKPKLRQAIETLKQRNDVKGRVIQVADKGLNCAKNIYAAVKEANDGYIFSKSIKGLSKEEREWIFLKYQGINEFIDVRNEKDELLYSYKVCKGEEKGEIVGYDKYTYKFKNDEGKDEEFTVKEKRIVFYNPKLAAKQIREINREVEKLRTKLSFGEALGEEYGDSSKYISKKLFDKDGNKIKTKLVINEEKVEEDKKLAGYNLIVTSEINVDPIVIYQTYHHLWRIEHSFRVMKTYLEARPAFVSSLFTIYGHFTIVYFALTLMRLIELKVFEDKIPIEQLFDFIRDYNVSETSDGMYVNNATASETYKQIKAVLGLAKLGNAYLRKKDIDNILKCEF